jgi:hypothetical protein
LLKFAAITVAAMIVISSSALMESFDISGKELIHETDLETVNRKSLPQDSPIDKNPVLAQIGTDWESFNTSAPNGTLAEASVVQSNNTGLTVVAYFHGFWRSNVTLNGTIYDNVDLPGCTPKIAEGFPALPRLTLNLEIPHSVDITVHAIVSITGTIEGYQIAPVQPSTLGIPNAPRPAFAIDTGTYSSDTFYPNYNTTIHGGQASSPNIMRGRRLLVVSLYPVKFNPVSRQLIAYSQMEVRINYSHSAQIEPVDSALYSEAFEKLYQGFLLNYIHWTTLTPNVTTNPLFRTSRIFSPSYYDRDGADYLIIAYDDFAEQAQVLADWKTRKGIFTEVRLASEIFQLAPDTLYEVDEATESDDTELFRRIGKMKEFIKYLYDEWDPFPTYFLIFGDSNHIPCDYNMSHTATYDHEEYTVPIHVHGAEEDDRRIATDVTYFCVDEKDYYQDAVHGRLSVENDDQAWDIVNKILQYEQNPTDDDIFYRSALVSALYDENEPFVETTEAVAQHIENQLTLVPYEVHRAYVGGPGESADTSDVITNIDEGRFLVYHLDHGTSENFYWYLYPDPLDIYGRFDGWADPRFAISYYPTQERNDIQDLDNQNRLPFVLSMDCSTGWFDGETDGLIDTNNLYPRRYDSFAEEITRKGFGGAIAAIASTRTSFIQHSAHLTLGITEAFWPGLVYEGITRAPEYNMGIALWRAKQFIHDRYAYDEEEADKQEGNVTLLLYHLFGDPETELWTGPGLPRILSAGHDLERCIERRDNIIVTVTDELGAYVENAKVCLDKEGEIYAIAFTNSYGVATFNVRPSTTGDLHVTATKHNWEPSISEMTIIQCLDWIEVLGVVAFVVLVVILVVVVGLIVRRKREANQN